MLAYRVPLPIVLRARWKSVSFFQKFFVFVFEIFVYRSLVLWKWRGLWEAHIEELTVFVSFLFIQNVKYIIQKKCSVLEYIFNVKNYAKIWQKKKSLYTWSNDIFYIIYYVNVFSSQSHHQTFQTYFFSCCKTSQKIFLWYILIICSCKNIFVVLRFFMTHTYGEYVCTNTVGT